MTKDSEKLFEPVDSIFQWRHRTVKNWGGGLRRNEVENKQ